MFHKFPDEIIDLIFVKLDVKDLVDIKLVSRDCQSLVDDYFKQKYLMISFEDTNVQTIQKPGKIHLKMPAGSFMYLMIPYINCIKLDCVEVDETLVKFVQSCDLNDFYYSKKVNFELKTKNLISSNLFPTNEQIFSLYVDSKFDVTHLINSYDLQLIRLTISNFISSNDLIQVFEYCPDITSLKLYIKPGNYFNRFVDYLNRLDVPHLKLVIMGDTNDDLFHLYTLIKKIQLPDLQSLQITIKSVKSCDINAKLMILIHLLSKTNYNCLTSKIQIKITINEPLVNYDLTKIELIKSLPVVLQFKNNFVNKNETNKPSCNLGYIYKKYSYLQESI